MTNLSHRVIPNAADYKKACQSSALGWFGCGSVPAFIVALIVFIIMADVGWVEDEWPFVLYVPLMAFLFLGLAHILTYRIGLDRTPEARELWQSISQSIKELDGVLCDCTEAIASGQAEYDASAFAPFWDAIEEAAGDLDHCSDVQQRLARAVKRYREILHDRHHTFPTASIPAELLSRLTSALNEFHQLVRMGQTSFDFAMIWEQRKTRDVLIENFRTLGEAVQEVGRAVRSATAELSAALEEVAEEEVATQERVGKAIEDLSEKLGKNEK